MRYKNITEGYFLERSNRFVAKVRIDDRVETVHVKNTGRCRELLEKDARIYLDKSDNPNRTTIYDLVVVKKGQRLVNMDAQAPNRAAEEWIKEGNFFRDVRMIRPETTYGRSRFDFYIETQEDRVFMEVKGVTLEQDGVVLFPDAPSERAVKHIDELVAAKREGYRAVLLFVIQMEGVRYFTPNRETHAEFADALIRAEAEGVEILAYDCTVAPDFMKIRQAVPVELVPCGHSEWKNGRKAIIESREPEVRASEGRGTESREPEDRASEGRGAESREPEDRASEGRGTESREPEDSASEGRGTESREPEDSASEIRISENDTTVYSVVESELRKPEIIKNREKIKEIFRKGSLESIPNLLLKWYDINKRVLPWRETPDPYRIWVSEIMLQQTRVEAVKLYFERFMKVLPDVRALAEAEEDQLLKLWEGLGYYNRARNLQRAAIQVMEEWGGKMPDTYEELLRLPGVGNYTAGAIASIAFNRAVPAVDGNVMRVIARFRQDGRYITDVKVRESVERDVKKIIPAERPGEFNQALMETGACVCIPNGMPLCGKCPLAECCMAHGAGMELEYPKKAEKKPRKREDRTILVVMDGDRVAIRRRPQKGLLAGLYELPSLEGFRTGEEVAEYLADCGLKILHIRPLEEAKHIFTHREWHMKGYLIRVDELEPGRGEGELKKWLYVDTGEVKEKYPIPSAFGAYTKYLC